MSALPDATCGCRPPLRLCSYHEGYRDALDAVATDPDASLDGGCRCGRTLVCSSCLHDAGECECADLGDELAEAEAAIDGEDAADLDPLTRTLLGLPSGIHCHDGSDRCLSGHCSEVSS